jgi:hypothetical protein
MSRVRAGVRFASGFYNQQALGQYLKTSRRNAKAVKGGGVSVSNQARRSDRW